MNYLRDWEIKLTPYDLSEAYVKTLKTESSRTITDLKVLFTIRKTFLGDPLLGSFQIFNIGPRTEALLTSGACVLSISVGWKGRDKALLFQGEITNSYPIRQGPDLVWNVWARDSGSTLTNLLLEESITGSITRYGILNKIVAAAPDIESVRFTGTSQSILNTYTEDEGYTLSESVTDELNSLLAPLSIKWVVDSGVLILVAEEDGATFSPGDLTPVDVSPRTGLLTVPKIDWVSVEFDHVLDPRFYPGAFMNLEQQTVAYDFGNEFYVPADSRRERRLAGIFKVMEATHRGDTRGNQWITSVKAFSEYGDE